VALQGDQILVGGYADGDFVVYRYDEVGVLDTTFGDGDGHIEIDFNGGDDQLSSMAVQEDGKIILAGSSNSNRFALARCTADGLLDTTFGSSGTTVVDVAVYAGSESCWDVAQDQNGSIIAVGQALVGQGQYDAVAIRLTSSGDLDTDFGDAGVFQWDNGPSRRGQGVAIQPDGRIVLGCTTGPQQG